MEAGRAVALALTPGIPQLERLTIAPRGPILSRLSFVYQVGADSLALTSRVAAFVDRRAGSGPAQALADLTTHAVWAVSTPIEAIKQTCPRQISKLSAVQTRACLCAEVIVCHAAVMCKHFEPAEGCSCAGGVQRAPYRA